MYQGTLINGEYKKQSLVDPKKKVPLWASKSTLLEPLWMTLRKREMSPELALPDFLCIGAQKAGTTWLFSMMSNHNEIHLPKQVKELHYFDWQFYRSLRWYSQFFENNENRVKGEITPGYSILSESRVKFISQIMPKVKVILLIRNPIDRAWSHMLMNLYRDKHRQPNLDLDRKKIMAHLLSERSTARGSFKTIIERWSRYMEDDNIHFAFFDSITTNPKEMLNKVFHFLGVSEVSDWQNYDFSIRPNRGVAAEITDEYASVLQEIYKEDLTYLKLRFDYLPNWKSNGVN